MEVGRLPPSAWSVGSGDISPQSWATLHSQEHLPGRTSLSLSLGLEPTSGDLEVVRSSSTRLYLVLSLDGIGMISQC